jgi:hypothetical protein
MIFEKACALMSAAMIAASVGLSNRNVPVVHAQELSIGGHYTVQPATRGNSLAGRIVVHPVHFKRWSDQIDDTSAAVLDYAASIMKNHPPRSSMSKCPPFRLERSLPQSCGMNWRVSECKQ